MEYRILPGSGWVCNLILKQLDELRLLFHGSQSTAAQLAVASTQVAQKGKTRVPVTESRNEQWGVGWSTRSCDCMLHRWLN